MWWLAHLYYSQYVKKLQFNSEKINIHPLQPNQIYIDLCITLFCTTKPSNLARKTLVPSHPFQWNLKALYNHYLAVSKTLSYIHLSVIQISFSRVRDCFSFRFCVIDFLSDFVGEEVLDHSRQNHGPILKCCTKKCPLFSLFSCGR